MKAIMLSVHPEWVAKILNGEKTIEIRKSVPKYFEGWVYIYCTKGEPTIHQRKTLSDVLDDVHFGIDPTPPILNGKVVARFWFDGYRRISTYKQSSGQTLLDYWVDPDILKEACLTMLKLANYGKGKTLYAWHIKRLEVFAKPKELREFESRYEPPPNWYYIEVEET